MLINHIYHGDNIEVMSHFPANIIDSIVTDPPYGLKFLNRKWDYDIPSVECFKEMLRIAKPGAILLCFGGSRTYHRIAINIEDAGWDLKDTIMWAYLTGFPKGIDISKSFDRYAGAERKVLVKKRVMRNTDTWGKGGMLASGEQNFDITEPATNLAKVWDGYNTALKPCYEPIILAVKPTPYTFVDNAIKYGVAGMNIGDSRIDLSDKDKTLQEGVSGRDNEKLDTKGVWGFKRVDRLANLGRWPTNILFDEEAAEANDLENGWELGDTKRFFFVPKPDQKEKDIGVEDGNPHVTVKPLDLMRYLCTLTRPPTGGIVLDPFCGSGTTLMGAVLSKREYIGIDIGLEYVETAKERVKGIKPDEWLKTPKTNKNQINMFETCNDL